jgi:endonuclease YncB( thermonuclease family)
VEYQFRELLKRCKHVYGMTLVTYIRDRIHKYLLKTVTDKVKPFNMDNVKVYGMIVNVYDGDTFRACVYHNGVIKKLTFRPLGYDTPEIRPLKSIENREAHIQKAIEARKRFIEISGGVGSYVFLCCGNNDKYGRVLVTLYKKRKSTKSINQLMIESGVANIYGGGTKGAFVFEPK